MQEIISEIINSIEALTILEVLGLILGIMSSILLIKNSISTWPVGIAFVVVSIIVLWNFQLYGDVINNAVFFVLYCYAWYEWLYGKNEEAPEYPITRSSTSQSFVNVGIVIIGTFIFAQFLFWLPSVLNIEPASLPYWDSLTTVIGFVATWLTARKKLDSWMFWLTANVLLTGIYFYKGLYYYSLLYLIYIGFAIWGYLSWKKIMAKQ